MAESKIMMPRLASEDTSLTQTPRSSEDTTTSQSPVSSSPVGSRCGSKSDDTDSEAESPRSQSGVDEDAYHDHDEYYTFLRELAGSFEATCEDDESEVSSDEGSTDEDEDRQAVSSSQRSFPGDDPDNDLLVSPLLVGRGRALGAGGLQEELEELEDFGKSSCSKPRFSIKSAEKVQGAGHMLTENLVPAMVNRSGCPAVVAAGSFGLQHGRQLPPPSCVAAPPGPSLGSGVDGHRNMAVSTPSSDRRGPVVDDYDVVKATVEFAQQREGTRFDHQRKDLLDAITLRTSQAKKLFAPARNKHYDPELRSHYARIHNELMAEVRSLENQSESLEEARRQAHTAPLVSCSLAGGALAEALMGRQEAHIDGVVVQ